MRIATIGLKENGNWDLNTVLYDDDAIQLLVKQRLKTIKGDNLWDTTLGLDPYEMLHSATKKKVGYIMEQISGVNGIISVVFMGSIFDDKTNSETLTFQYKTVFDGVYSTSTVY